MTTEQILWDCKNEIARKYEFSSFHDLTTDLEYHAVKEKTFTEIENESMILFAQRMAEKFAEWMFEEGILFQGNPLQEKEPSELYTEFLTTLNKDK